MRQHCIYLIGGDDDETATFTEEIVGNKCRLTCEHNRSVHQSLEWDFFAALCEIRLILEKQRLIPFCYGASLNVYPSGMSRDMGSGLKAYKHTMGQRASRNDLVGIFEVGTDIIPATVALQKEFWDEWVAGVLKLPID